MEAQTRGAEHLRGLLERAIDSGQGRGRGDHDDGKVKEGLHEDDAAESLHEGKTQAEALQEEEVDHALPAQDLLERDGAHERRHDEGQEPERGQHSAAGKLIAGGEPGERDGDQAAESHNEHPGKEGVGERPHEERPREDRGEVLQRRPVVDDHRAHQDVEERQNDGRSQQEEQQGDHHALRPHPFGSGPPRHEAAAGWSSGTMG